MNRKDRKLLNRLQENFPLVERPYQKIAGEVGLSEDKVIERIEGLLAEGIIRRFGVLLNHKKMHYFSTLLGVRIPEKRLKEIVALVTLRPEVTHCYHREGEFNLWFTFLTPKKAVFNKFLSGLKKRVGAENVLNMPTIQSFKLKTTFEV